MMLKNVKKLEWKMSPAKRLAGFYFGAIYLLPKKKKKTKPNQLNIAINAVFLQINLGDKIVSTPQ